MKKSLLTLLLQFLVISLFAQSDGIKRKLIWADEFNYQGLPDPSKWDYEVGLVRNKEPQYYTKARLENARVDGGKLVIEAKKETYKGAQFTSASLITLGKQHFKYGRIEVRAKVCKGIGSWPAIWLLGTNRGAVKWPDCGEIDIMEFVGKDSSLVYGTVHYADSTNTYKYKGEKPDMGKPYEDFHIYAINWTKENIEFYYDNKKYFTFNLKDAQGRENPFKKDFYLLLNLALGRQGTLGGPLNEDILPLKYEVDYVRVYKTHN